MIAPTSPQNSIKVCQSRPLRARREASIYEVPISYYGRTYDEGKKINWKDGVKALWYLFKFRFA